MITVYFNIKKLNFNFLMERMTLYYISYTSEIMMNH
jgi:hypothetical protein